MFKTSLRLRGASSISRPSTPTTITATITQYAHQRRHSSSKPPVPPNNGSYTITATSVKTVGGPRTKEATDKRPGSEPRLSKRKTSKEKLPEQDEWTKSLPSVPSTNHLSEKDVCLASFFSIHRPISINSALPTQVSPEDFEKIFQPKPKPSRSRSSPHEIIYTLSNVVQNLDENIQTQQQDQNVQQKSDMIAALTQHNQQTQHLDGQPQQGTRGPAGVKLVIQEIARRFRPYNPPPAPIAVSDAELELHEAEAAAAEATEQQRAQTLDVRISGQDEGEAEIQTVVLNVHQNADDLQNGQFFTHCSPSISVQTQDGDVDSAVRAHETPGPSTQPLTYLERKGKNSNMYTISVKRQRRLKMKKHKYKKLMRKTRNLRRRQDKL